jgi:hypothetical protein
MYNPNNKITMGLFGFSSKKEVQEKERLAREAARKEALGDLRERDNKTRQSVLQGQQNDLANIAKGSQVSFKIPYFDVYDPRFENFAVPVAVRVTLVYGVNDIALFNSINKTQNISDNTFQDKLKGQITKFVKGVVTNAPADHQIPVLKLESKIVEISELVQNYVTPKIERLFGVNVRSIDITDITVDNQSKGYRELKAVTTELEKDSLQARSSLNIDAWKRQQEMNLGGQEEMQRMQLEHQRETMRIQREELQRASRLQTETNFLGAHQANLNASVQTAQAQTKGGVYAPQIPGMPPMPGMGVMPPMPGSTPQVSYMVGVNGQQYGPCDWNQLQQLVQQGYLTHQTYVWKQGMPQWQMAGEVMELTPLFQGSASQIHFNNQ